MWLAGTRRRGGCACKQLTQDAVIQEQLAFWVSPVTGGWMGVSVQLLYLFLGVGS